ncbi:gag/pol/env polyprotein, putative [Perkinsus marinus ATCC 50983]|uniref:Gag/pol/env polyprotein, putative n=1 Tax=Perkinsus marinus (strain ATCC 50983 / TXsc) TaxID=423536 RepID=C5LXK7_PERM5|nr:gag/pol/env polyprotein, putative [Perkinsus marinus ATCC 50983]EEQ98529.1 gag/pol/env polyprotein, putative [Perkinsus marinus ATCC 50983]|eukprot:XP_002765812.1 gag/pol/env polyprotein, putative [Perkinsus marinus ATCC 50983]
MADSALCSSSGDNDERELQTTLGAVPRKALITNMLALEEKIYTETGPGYSQALTPFREALLETLKDNERFKSDCHAVQSGLELCDLWQNSYAWLSEELVYLDSAGEEDSKWLTLVLRWSLLAAAANIDGCPTFVGRQDLRKEISATVSKMRHASTMPSAVSYPSNPSATPLSTAFGQPATNSASAYGSTAIGTNHTRTSSSLSPCEIVRRTVKSIVGDSDKIPKHLLFTGNPTGTYFPWRVAVCDLLRHHHLLPNDISAEVALHCITEPLKSTIRSKITHSDILASGVSAVWSVMDKRYNTNLELRSLENALDALSQEPSESTLDFCTRFEKLWHVKQSVVPDEAAQDSSIIRRLKKGLKDPKAVLAASLADPLNKMDFDTFKDTLLAVIDDLPDINALTKSAPKGDKSKSRSVDDDSSIMALCMAAAVDLGLSKDSCLRCGKLGHVAARCKASPDDIIRKDERCKRCGRLADSKHRCDSSRFHCKRCRKAHHLAGVCLKKFSNSSAPSNTNNHQSNNASDIKLVNNSAAYVSAANAQINYSASDLFATSSPDPTITVRLGTGAQGPRCDVSCLVDTGANISLVDASVVKFLLDNTVIPSDAVSTLDRPLKVTYGNNSTTSTSTIVSVNCSLEQPSSDVGLVETRLLFLQVEQCLPRVIIGRNMFDSLGIIFTSTKGISLKGGLSLSSSRQDNASQTDESSVYHNSSCAIINLSSTDESTLPTVDFTAESSAEPIATCRRVSTDVQPLISVVQDGTGKRLCCDIDPIGNATVWPYRAAQRKRTAADAEIIYQKLCAMEAQGKVRRVQDSELSIVCEPILIDKLDRADGKSKIRTVPVSDSELSSRYRLVIDTRPLNSLQLSYDDAGNFIFLPGGEIPKDSKQRDEFSYKQHQRTATNLLRDVPSANLGFWSKLDLRDAYGCIAVTKSLQKLFGTTSICPRTGVTVRWALTSLPQGWRWSSLAFQVGFGTLLDTVINPKLVADGIAATVVHVQDDVLVSSQTIVDGEKALRVLTDILTEYGFIINQEKSQSPAKSTTFCGLLLHGRTYRPLPAKREISEATFNAAFNDFLNGKAPPKRRGRRRVKHSAESLRQSRLSWLRSWTGVFNYFSGHLLPDAIAALRTLNGAIKHYQDEATSADFLETLTTPTSDAFKVLLRAYIAGTLPCSLGNDGIGTLAVVDANHDSYGAIIFKVFELSGDATEFATYSKTVFNCIPNLGELFNISEDRVAILPLRVCGERFSKVESSRSSTWRERAALLNVIHDNQCLLSGRIIAVTDNANVGKHWHSVETEFGIGTYLSRWQTYQRCVHLTTWAPRGSLPAIADAIARSLEVTTPSSVKVSACNSRGNCHATGTDTGDSELRHSFSSSLTPASTLLGIFSAWRIKAASKPFPVHDDDIDALKWLANAQGECFEVQHLHDVNPKKFVMNDCGIITVKGCYVVPRAYARDVVTRVHTQHGHCGLQQTLSIVKEVFYVIGLSAIAAKVVSSCRCFFSRAVRSARHSVGSLRHRRDIMELIYVDIVGPLPSTRGTDGGYKYILTWLDSTSGYVGGIPLRKATSYEICNAPEHHVLDVYGRVKEIASDNGAAFSSSVFLSWCSSYAIRPWKIPVYCPWRNGQLERCHRSIKATLRCLCDSVQHKWDRYLSKALFRCNSRIIPDTDNISPFMLMFGESRTVLRRFLSSPASSFPQSLSDVVRNMVDMRNTRLDAIFGNTDDVKPTIDPVPQCNQHRRSASVKVGDSVLKWSPSTGHGPLGTHWSGPYTVTHKRGHQTVILSDGSLQDCRNVRKWHGKTPASLNPTSH